MKDADKDGNSTRWKIDGDDKKMLEEEFMRKRFPSPRSKKRMADQLNVEPRRIQVWFQNRRQREKPAEDDEQAGAGSDGASLPSGQPGGARYAAPARAAAPMNDRASWPKAFEVDAGAYPPSPQGRSNSGASRVSGSKRSRPRQGARSGTGGGAFDGGEDADDTPFGESECYPMESQQHHRCGSAASSRGDGSSGAPALGEASRNGSRASSADASQHVLANPGMLGSSDDIVCALMDFDKGNALPAEDGDSLWAIHHGAARGRAPKRSSGLFGSSGSLVALEEICGQGGSEGFDDLRRRTDASVDDESSLGTGQLGGGGMDMVEEAETHAAVASVHRGESSGRPSPESGEGDAAALSNSFQCVDAPFQPPSEASTAAMGGLGLHPIESSTSALERKAGGPTPSESSNEGTSTAWGSRGTPTMQMEAGDFPPSAIVAPSQLIPQDSATAVALLEAAARGNYALLGGFAAASVQHMAALHGHPPPPQGIAGPYATAQQVAWLPTANAMPIAAAQNAPSADHGVAREPLPVGAVAMGACGDAALDASCHPDSGAGPNVASALASAPAASAPPPCSGSVSTLSPDRALWTKWATYGGGADASLAEEVDETGSYEIPQQLAQQVAASSAAGGPSYEMNSWSNAAAAVNAVLTNARQQYSLALNRPLQAPAGPQGNSYGQFANSNFAFMHAVSDGHVRGGRALGQNILGGAQNILPGGGGQGCAGAAQPNAAPIGQPPLRSSRLPYRSDDLPPPLGRPAHLLEQQLQLQQATQLQQLQQQMLMQQREASTQSQQMQALVQAQIMQHREQLQHMQQQETAQGSAAAAEQLQPPPHQQPNATTSMTPTARE
jgi:hypothetical protein